LKHYTPS